ncbi:MAG: ribosome biogenesis GTPase Der [Bdellovibrionales bacterium]|nr:ribosome biogenesis GTPase Der [Bdellovibrionales bacterium]
MNRVLIMGRPNVGKSSLFNKLVRRRKALVINQPGVTRDVLKQKTSWWGVDFEVWDSGGLWSEDSHWGDLIDQKVRNAVQQSDLILFIMDARSGFLAEDKKTFQLVKKSGKPFLALVNKVDNIDRADELLSDFYGLGVSLLPCAFEQDRGVVEIAEWILSHSKSTLQVSSSKETPNVCLLLAGKTNVGKSTLCNALLKEDRVLTSSIAGTTVDVVTNYFKYAGRHYTLLDTAGKTKHTQNKAQSLAELKSAQGFTEADIILLLVDYSTGPGRQEARLFDLCVEKHKAIIVVINKWDLNDKAENIAKTEYRKNIQKKFCFYPDVPIVFISALNSQGLSGLMKKVDEVYRKLRFRISTSELNRFFTQVIRKAPAPVYGTQDVKFYYLTQTHHTPPSFIAFANYPKGVRASYRRFLVRQIQNKWGLKGIPIRISVLPR